MGAVDDGVLAALYAVVLAAGWAAGQLLRPPERRPWATLVALVVVGVPTLVKMTAAPALLPVLTGLPVGRPRRVHRLRNGTR
jgi:4-amino-4-deoxy-L-arabinose transferase-like glycosyltransferase